MGFLPLTRRQLALTAAALPLLRYGAIHANEGDACPTLPDTVADAFEHLNIAMDRAGESPRLPSSFNMGDPTPPGTYENTHLYDDALIIIAYLHKCDDDAIARASEMGDAIIALQEADRDADGRVRNSYGVPIMLEDGTPNYGAEGSATGNMAWTGLALTHLYHHTKEQRYLDAAIKLANFVYDTTYSTDGPGGFLGGLNSDGTAIEWKSAEHNIDATGFFSTLGEVSGDTKWTEAGEHARQFVREMWNGTNFYVGTGTDGITLNTDDNPVEDVQSWGYMVLPEEKYAPGLDWARETLEVTDPTTDVTGMKFSAGDDPTNTVWLEGSCHMALAMKLEGSEENLASAKLYLDGCEKMQREGENTNGLGLIQATRIGTAGGDDDLHPSLHTGATAWYILAQVEKNPYILPK